MLNTYICENCGSDTAYPDGLCSKCHDAHDDAAAAASDARNAYRLTNAARDLEKARHNAAAAFDFSCIYDECSPAARDMAIAALMRCYQRDAAAAKAANDAKNETFSALKAILNYTGREYVETDAGRATLTTSQRFSVNARAISEELPDVFANYGGSIAPVVTWRVTFNK